MGEAVQTLCYTISMCVTQTVFLCIHLNTEYFCIQYRVFLYSSELEKILDYRKKLSSVKETIRWKPLSLNEHSAKLCYNKVNRLTHKWKVLLNPMKSWKNERTIRKKNWKIRTNRFKFHVWQHEQAGGAWARAGFEFPTWLTSLKLDVYMEVVIALLCEELLVVFMFT